MGALGICRTVNISITVTSYYRRSISKAIITTTNYLLKQWPSCVGLST